MATPASGQTYLRLPVTSIRICSIQKASGSATLRGADYAALVKKVAAGAFLEVSGRSELASSLAFVSSGASIS